MNSSSSDDIDVNHEVHASNSGLLLDEEDKEDDIADDDDIVGVFSHTFEVI